MCYQRRGCILINKPCASGGVFPDVFRLHKVTRVSPCARLLAEFGGSLCSARDDVTPRFGLPGLLRFARNLNIVRNLALRAKRSNLRTLLNRTVVIATPMKSGEAIP